MEISILKEAGLTEGEVKVYMSLLELGSSTSGPIIEKSGVARSIIYQLLDKLMDKGLVSYVTKEKTKYYQSAEPDKILQYIGEREKQLKKNKEAVEKLIPELILKQKLVPKNEANFYSGYEGMRTAHEHTYLKLKPGEEYVYLGIPSYQPEKHHWYWQRDHKRREKTGIKCRLLFNKGTDPKIIAERNTYKGCESRAMVENIKTYAGFLVYKDTTTIMIQSPTVFAVEIVNQETADSLRSYFEEFWKNTKP